MVHSLDNSQIKLIKGIINNDPLIIKNIYKDNFGKIRSMVNNFHNVSLNADDVFQDGLTRAVINIRKGMFKGDSSFSTYLYGICRNICLKEYNKQKGIYQIPIQDKEDEVEYDHYDEIKILLELKNKLQADCKKIIDLRFGIGMKEFAKEELKFNDIADKMNIMLDNARQKFKRCMSKLIELVRQTSLKENLQKA